MTFDGTPTLDPQTDQPICTIIAGPNGAGKTTFALGYLPTFGPSRNFVNADLIAGGLSPLDPEKAQLEASRLFLAEVHEYIRRRESFAFETTLSGRTYLRMIRQLTSDGWIVQMFYLWLPSVEACLQRVAERVKHGGHNIPADVIERRYFRSVRNVMFEYAPACSSCICLANWQADGLLVFRQRGAQRTIRNNDVFTMMEEAANHE
jgi:predicted ABC-type ATPase